jgi:membrane protein YdbS with pleckstrin-like domain
MHYETPADRVDRERQQMAPWLRCALATFGLVLAGVGLGFVGEWLGWPFVQGVGFVLVLLSICGLLAAQIGFLWTLWRQFRAPQSVEGGADPRGAAEDA